MTKPKLPRATLKQKIEVLDYIDSLDNPTQAEVLRHFKELHKFAISQATLSNWTLRADQLRQEYDQNPNWQSYKRMPVLKFPELTKAVEKYVSDASANGTTITDGFIRSAFAHFIREYGLSDKDFNVSSGMIHSFKKRNDIQHGQYKRQRTAEYEQAVPQVPQVPQVQVPQVQVPQVQRLALDPTPSPSQTNTAAQAAQLGVSASNSSIDDLDINFDEIFANPIVGFNTRLIHSDDPQDFNPALLTQAFQPQQPQDITQPVQNTNTNTPLSLRQHGVPPPLTLDSPTADDVPMAATSSVPRGLETIMGPPHRTKSANAQVITTSPDMAPLPSYPSFDSPMQYKGYSRRPYTLENFSYSKSSHPNSEKVEKILQNITDGYVTIYNSGTSAIMGILSYLNPPMVAINNSGYQGTHSVIRLLAKLTGLRKMSFDEMDDLVPHSVILLETPMNPEGYNLDISKYAKIAHSKGAVLLVDSTLAPPPLQFPFNLHADYIVYSAVKYLAGVSDLSAGFVVTRNKEDKKKLHEERFALGTSIANFDSFLLLRSLRTYKMRILTQCSNTKKVISYLRKHLSKYTKVVSKLHHSSLQTNSELFRTQLNGYYNPVFALEFKDGKLAEKVLTRFNFLSNNPALEGGETLVELTSRNPNFGSTSNLLRFSVGCEDYQDIIRDIDQAIISVCK